MCAPWEDAEGLFTPARDYVIARTGAEMKERLREIVQEPERAAALATHGLRTIRSRHTCAHRVDELLTILGECGPTRTRAQATSRETAAAGEPRG